MGPPSEISQGAHRFAALRDPTDRNFGQFYSLRLQSWFYASRSNETLPTHRNRQSSGEDNNLRAIVRDDAQAESNRTKPVSQGYAGKHKTKIAQDEVLC